MGDMPIPSQPVLLNTNAMSSVPNLSVGSSLGNLSFTIYFFGHRHTHTHTFNGSFSGTTWVNRYQKGKTNLDFTDARDSEWQWHQLGCMEVCTSLQRDDHANTLALSFYRRDAFPAAQATAAEMKRG